MLAGYGLFAACTQLLWLSYAFIKSQAHRAMGVSVGDEGDLAAIFSLMYVASRCRSGSGSTSASSGRSGRRGRAAASDMRQISHLCLPSAPPRLGRPEAKRRCCGCFVYCV